MNPEAGPNLRAAASLSEEEARRLLAVGLRSLPSDHELRALASWSRRAWRPSVRVHALRALVRSPSALANLSSRAQDNLFAVFRTVNTSNRHVCAAFFGVLLLADDPWLIDTGGEGVDDDARRAEEAFLRLYDARHEYLGNRAFGTADVINRESDALRRRLVQTTPRRAPIPESVSKAKKSTDPFPATAPSDASASVMRGVDHPERASTEPDVIMGSTPVEKKVLELLTEVEKLKTQLRDNEKRTKHLQSLFDFMAKVLLDELQISVAVPHNIVSTNRKSGRSLDRSQTTPLSSSDPCLPKTTSSFETEEMPDAEEDGVSGRLEQRLRLLERFRTILEASPWQGQADANGSSEGGSNGAGAGSRQGATSSGSGPVAVFRDGRWVDRRLLDR